LGFDALGLRSRRQFSQGRASRTPGISIQATRRDVDVVGGGDPFVVTEGTQAASIGATAG